MESQKYIAHNNTRNSLLSSSVTPVNASLEPLKVLKVLIEGLPENAKAGLWLTNFKGVPVSRTLSPFDLIYLDKDFRVVHSIELSRDGEFAPFKGQPSSALVLPPQSISLSQTATGDQLEIRVAEQPVKEPAGIAKPLTPSDVPINPVRVQPIAPVLAEPPANARFYSATSTKPITVTEPTVPAAPVAAGSAAKPNISAAPNSTDPTLDVKRTAPVEQPRVRPTPGSNTRSKIPQASPSSAEARSPIPFPGAFGTQDSPVSLERPKPTPVKITINSAPVAQSPPASTEQPNESIQIPPSSVQATLLAAAPVDVSPSGDLATSIPAEPPALHPEATPNYGELDEYTPKPKEVMSWKVQFLRWLFPDLVIREAPKPRDRRRADRQPVPGLVAYYFTGGAPEPHKIGNISVTGFYMHTEERWMPGTVVRMTLQRAGSKGTDPADTITVHSKIVRWGEDGEGFEFILTDLKD
jgi:hypothetical protein